MAGRGGFFFFPRRDGAVVFFSEAGRGDCCFFPRRDGVAFFLFSTGRDGAVFFFFFEGRDGTVVFGGGIFFGGTGQNRYTVPPKAFLNRPASRPCKALILCTLSLVSTSYERSSSSSWGGYLELTRLKIFLVDWLAYEATMQYSVRSSSIATVPYSMKNLITYSQFSSDVLHGITTALQ